MNPVFDFCRSENKLAKINLKINLKDKSLTTDIRSNKVQFLSGCIFNSFFCFVSFLKPTKVCGEKRTIVESITRNNGCSYRYMGTVQLFSKVKSELIDIQK